MVRQGGDWVSPGAAVWVREAQQPSGIRDLCSTDQAADLQAEFGDMDIVIPWINGSDPIWLSNWASTCEDWQWYEVKSHQWI